MSPVMAMLLCPGSTPSSNSAFYHVFQDDEGLQTRYAQTLHGARESGARLFMLQFANATTSTAFKMAKLAGRTPSWMG